MLRKQPKLKNQPDSANALQFICLGWACLGNLRSTEVINDIANKTVHKLRCELGMRAFLWAGRQAVFECPSAACMLLEGETFIENRRKVAQQ